MTHYVCDECKNTSKNPGTCQIDYCTKNGLVMQECKCEDGMHVAILKNIHNEDDEKVEPRTTIDLDSADQNW